MTLRCFVEIMLDFLLLCILMTSCSGFGDSSFSSSMMYGERPILRSPDNPADAAPVSVKEPGWVSTLRQDIKSAINTRGFENAKSDIQYLIEDGPGAENILRSSSDDSQAGTKYSPRWERELTKYIKGLMGQYGKQHLEEFVKPVVKAVQSNNDIVIHDIDGEITINWTSTLVPNPKSDRDKALHQLRNNEK